MDERFHFLSAQGLYALLPGSTLTPLLQGEVTAEQRQQAPDTLRDRFKKQAERQKAAELAKRRQEKLRLLAEKFNAR